MDLRQEVALVASRLGFRPTPLFLESNVEAPGQKPNKRDDADREAKKQRQGRSKPKRPPVNTKKAGTKTDVYDKKALLEILSGPEERAAANLKKLHKARSVVPKSTSPIWHVALDELPSLANKNKETAKKLTQQEIQQRRQEAANLCQNEKDAFEYRMHSSKKQGKWLLQLREQGTHVDRIAAQSLLIRDSVIANVSEVDYLLNLAEKQKGSRDLVVHALKAVTELFRCFLLPDRKLIFFEDRPIHLLGDKEEGKLYLILWFVEDSLKRKFARLVSCLEAASLAPLEHLRSEAVTLVSDLLYEKPEQEAYLLSILIHKLGDTVKRLGSKVAFLISKLIEKHPRMKLVIFKEAEKLVFKTGTTIKAVQCVLQVFNSIMYEDSDIDRETATLYVDMCFNLFQQLEDGNIGSSTDLEHKAEIKKAVIVGSKRKKAKVKLPKKAVGHEIDSTIFSSVIAGIRRTVPYADKVQLGELLEKHTQALFRMVHVAPFAVSVQVLALLTQILPVKANSLDRLYRAMYEKILDPQLEESRRVSLLISTLFKAIKEDPSLPRAVAFVKRLLQVTAHAEPHLQCAILLVIAEVMKFKPGLKSGIIQPEETMNEADGHETPQKGYPYRLDHREPVCCGADRTCLWELCSTRNHFHPVARSLGESLLSTQSAPSQGDPLQELTRSAFLDKFVNGKITKSKVSPVRRTPLTPGASLVAHYQGADTFATLAAKDIPVEDVFFHKYFTLLSVRKARDARQSATARKRSQKPREGDLDLPEETAYLKGDGDLESLESLELDGDDLGMHDVDEMFSKGTDLPEKQPNELYDYSELLQDVEGAYEESASEDAGESVSGGDLETRDVDDMGEALDLQAEEFPEISSDSSDMEMNEENSRTKAKRSSSEDDFSSSDSL